MRAKKIKFDDDDEDRLPEHEPPPKHLKKNKNVNENGNYKSQLFDENSDEECEINFEIKQQFEGETGQKVNLLLILILLKSSYIFKFIFS